MSRSRSRSPLNNTEGKDAYVYLEDDDLSHDEADGLQATGDDIIDCRAIKIENLPKYWNDERAKKFIHEITKSKAILNEIKLVKMIKFEVGAQGSCLVLFRNSHSSNLAMAEWSGLKQQKKINLKYSSDRLLAKQRKWEKQGIKKFNVQPHSQSNKKLNQNVVLNSSENVETYGLSTNFLLELNIKLPLGTKLHVGNLHPDVTETKLREIFSYAGQVVHVLILQNNNTPPKRYGKIEFDHPVEAVQAISMFHNQDLYSYQITVQMDSRPMKNKPEGLGGFGPGLGPNGERLRGIRQLVEIQHLKQTFMEELNKLKDEKSNQNKNVSNINPFQQDSSIMPMTSHIPGTPSNPFVTTTPIIPWNFMNAQPIAMPNMQLLHNINKQDTSTNLQQTVTALLQNSINSNLANLAQTNIQATPLQAAGLSNPQMNTTQSGYSAMDNKSSDYRNNHSDNYQKQYTNKEKYEDRGYTRSNSHNGDRSFDRSHTEISDMLLFKNLPPTVSLKALSSKMKEVGEVKFAELTGTGRAIVRFYRTSDAERCIKLFDKSKVDGAIIDVKYF